MFSFFEGIARVDPVFACDGFGRHIGDFACRANNCYLPCSSAPIQCAFDLMHRPAGYARVNAIDAMENSIHHCYDLQELLESRAAQSSEDTYYEIDVFQRFGPWRANNYRYR